MPAFSLLMLSSDSSRYRLHRACMERSLYCLRRTAQARSFGYMTSAPVNFRRESRLDQ